MLEICCLNDDRCNVKELENEHGLSNLLIDDIKNKHEEYIQKTEIKNLSVLTSGTVPPNPSKLISSSRNARLMGLLNEKYE